MDDVVKRKCPFCDTNVDILKSSPDAINVGSNVAFYRCNNSTVAGRRCTHHEYLLFSLAKIMFMKNDVEKPFLLQPK
jgi:hypothetical protein